MSDAPEGHIITFYSYKGGTGRTMALANTAWILAANGKRVLVVDWDLESPGLHKFFRPFLDGATIGATPGVIEMTNEYAMAARSQKPRSGPWHLDYAKVLRHAVSLEWEEFPGEGGLDFLSAGRQNRDYASLLSTFDWDDFYEELKGGTFFDAMRADMKRNYDYILIDSRTGLSDMADICTVQFPDTLVVCFTLSDQGIEGASAIARHIDERYHERGIRILPVPMRIDESEKERLEAGRSFARRQFDRFPASMDAGELRAYWGGVEIPYKPFYGFEETLAAFGDAPGSPNSLLAAFERLVGVITNGEIRSLPLMEEELRLRVRDKFLHRKTLNVPTVVTLSHVPEDRLWAEWIEATLTRAGFRVRRGGLTPPGDVQGWETNPYASRVVAVLSAAYLRSAEARAVIETPRGADPVAPDWLVPVRVTDIRLVPPFSDRSSADLMRLDEPQATEALLRVVGRPAHSAEGSDDPGSVGPRFPGTRPPVWNLPTRNATFTGRNAVLDRLRDQIVGSNRTVVLPQAVYGLGGVGKTQVALEYAHRFMADYDVVWWIPAEHLDQINPVMAELAPLLRLRVGDNVAEAAQAAREALRQGDPYENWLLIFDNADNPKDLERFLPSGAGHVLITSRNTDWSRVAEPLAVDVFTRQESIEHLLRRAPGLASEDADRVARALGDLPLAIEQAGAWLEQTGMPAGQYVEQLEGRLTEVLALAEPQSDYPIPVMATWNLSFDRLRERSPASVRLLELLAFFAPEPISLDMLYSDAMVNCLAPFDEAVREKLMLGPVILQLGRYALAKVDQADNSIQVHRLIQAVVRSQMDADQLDRTVHDVHRVLVAARPRVGDTDDPENWPRYEEIWPHLVPSAAAGCDEEETRRLLIDRVRYLWKRGEFGASLQLGSQLEEQWNEKLGKGDRQTVHLRFHLANTLRSQGRYGEARTVDTEVLTQQRRELGDYHVYTLMTAGGLAADLRALGDFQQALEMDGETYERLKELFGIDHRRTLMAAHNLGTSLRLAGHFARARDLDQETTDRRKVVLGDTHPYTLYSAASLARDLRELGNFRDCLEMMRVTLEQYRQVLGDDWLDTLRTANGLATALRRAGRESEARRQAEETVAQYSARYGPTMPDTLVASLELASCLALTQEVDRARDLAADAMGHFSRVYGEDHPYTLTAANNLAIYLRELGALREARDLAERTFAVFAARMGATHPSTLVSAIGTAGCLAELGDLPAAEALERQTLESLRAVLHAEHPDVLVCEANLAITLNAVGHTAEARQMRERVLNAMRRALGDDHPYVADLAAWRRVNRDLEPQSW
ncbi:FxSxx-COOH system tetratricopeptide repeat protein [Streptosporangium sp. NPDC023963]|uniref:FxSxx-COOH system tetratricopeptide repeat protein n=1 Tax=Streptosporangium sp. NPDC023963 TaxID=3155608 RepID=UPI00343A329D